MTDLMPNCNKYDNENTFYLFQWPVPQSVTLVYYISVTHNTHRHRAEYLADSELWIIGFSHGVVNEGGHQFSDMVQITGPGFLRDEWTQRKILKQMLD